MPTPAQKKSVPSATTRTAATTFQEQTLELIKAAPLVGLGAAALGMKVGVTSDLDSNVLGYVKKSAPNIIVLNDRLASQEVNGGMKHTIPHEWEHVLQNQASATYGKSYDTQIAESYISLGGSREKLVGQLEKSAASSKLNEHLQKVVGTPVAPYLGKLSKGQYSLREQFAELSSLEASTRKDLTKDPVVRAEFFGNDQDLIDVYKASTGYRTARLDARDLPPMTSQATQAESSIVSRILSAIQGATK